MRWFLSMMGAGLLAGTAGAAVTSTTSHSTDVNGLTIVSGDVLDGLIATELPADTGWHPANTNPADQLPALTDGAGMLGSGLTGLLNDFPGAGNPTKSIQYDLAAPTDLARIHVYSGNNGTDGRIFSTTVVRYSTDNGATFDELGYFQSDPSGTVNSAESNGWRATLVEIFDDMGGSLADGVTNLQFDFFSVSNTQGRMDDPFTGTNPFTSTDDGFDAAFESPLILEIDVVEVPEPATLGLVGLGALGLLRRRR